MVGNNLDPRHFDYFISGFLIVKSKKNPTAGGQDHSPDCPRHRDPVNFLGAFQRVPKG